MVVLAVVDVVSLGKSGVLINDDEFIVRLLTTEVFHNIQSLSFPMNKIRMEKV